MIVTVIQARMGSSRLPGKVLKDINGRTMLARVVRRASRSTLVNKEKPLSMNAIALAYRRFAAQSKTFWIGIIEQLSYSMPKQLSE